MLLNLSLVLFLLLHDLLQCVNDKATKFSFIEINDFIKFYNVIILDTK